MASQSKNFDRSKVKTFADAQKGRKMPWTYDGVLAVCEAAGKLVNPATGRCQSLFEDEETEDPSLKFDEKDGVLLAYDHRYPDVPFTDLLDKLDELREEYGEGTPNGNGAPKKEPYKPLSDAEIRARERALSGSPALAALKERGISHETACEWKLGAGKAKILDPVLGGPANAGRGEYIRLSALSIRDGEQVGVQGVNPDPSNKKYKVIARGERELTPDPQTVKGTVFVAESLTDAMSLTEMGFTSIAAPSATTWKAHYAAQFAGGDITQVCFLYDWDAEGRKGTKKAAPKVAKFVDDVRVLDISDGLPLNEGDKGFDLNDLLMEVGPDAAREHIERLVEETEPYAKPDGDDEPEEENYFSYSDLGNAERLAAQEAGSMMYVATHNDWYRYLRRKGVWKKAEMLEQDSAYTRMVKNMIHEAAEMDNSKARDALLNHVRRSESANSKGGCLSFARSRKQLAVHWSQLDAHPNRLNCQNGILDLESFELHKHDPSEYHTKITRGAFIEDAYSKEWESFS